MSKLLKKMLIAVATASIGLSASAAGIRFIDCDSKHLQNIGKNDLCIARDSGAEKTSEDFNKTQWVSYILPVLYASKAPGQATLLAEIKARFDENTIGKATGETSTEYVTRVGYVNAQSQLTRLNKDFFGTDYQYLVTDAMTYPINPKIKSELRKHYRLYTLHASILDYLTKDHAKGAVSMNVSRIRAILRGKFNIGINVGHVEIAKEVNCLADNQNSSKILLDGMPYLYRNLAEKSYYPAMEKIDVYGRIMTTSKNCFNY
jgi:hypothetical protein